MFFQIFAYIVVNLLMPDCDIGRCVVKFCFGNVCPIQYRCNTQAGISPQSAFSPRGRNWLAHSFCGEKTDWEKTNHYISSCALHGKISKILGTRLCFV